MDFLFSRQRLFVLVLVSLLSISTAFNALAQEQPSESDDAVAIFNQGQDAHEKGDLKTAIELYQKALKIIPEFPEAEYQMGAAYLSLGQTENAEKACQIIIEKSK